MDVLPARTAEHRSVGRVPLSYNVFRNLLPAEDFRYFSRARADVLSLHCSEYIFTHGRKGFVDVTRPLL